jgi:hypothetical protein
MDAFIPGTNVESFCPGRTVKRRMEWNLPWRRVGLAHVPVAIKVVAGFMHCRRPDCTRQVAMSLFRPCLVRQKF